MSLKRGESSSLELESLRGRPRPLGERFSLGLAVFCLVTDIVFRLLAIFFRRLATNIRVSPGPQAFGHGRADL